MVGCPALLQRSINAIPFRFEVVKQKTGAEPQRAFFLTLCAGTECTTDEHVAVALDDALRRRMEGIVVKNLESFYGLHERNHNVRAALCHISPHSLPLCTVVDQSEARLRGWPRRHAGLVSAWYIWLESARLCQWLREQRIHRCILRRRDSSVRRHLALPVGRCKSTCWREARQ